MIDDQDWKRINQRIRTIVEKLAREAVRDARRLESRDLRDIQDFKPNVYCPGCGSPRSIDYQSADADEKAKLQIHGRWYCGECDWELDDDIIEPEP